MKRYLVLLGLFAVIFFGHSYATVSAGLNCSIIESASCSNADLLYFRNDSSGYYNAHAQLPSNGTYPFTLCCDALAVNDTIDNTCGDAVFLVLNKTSNSHVQRTTRNEYSNNVCINSVNGNVTCGYYNSSCPTNYTCLTSMASSETADYNQTNAHVGSCDEYITKVCCRLNSPPNSVNLTAPGNNTDITNRTPNFAWNASDPDSDTMTFDLYIYCQGGCSIDNRIYLGIDYTNYTIPDELKYFGDDNYWYRWIVRAYDGSAYTNSSPFNFTLRSLITLTLINSTVDFGSMNLGTQNDTSDNLPMPFLLRNDGNSFVDVNISAEDLIWEQQQSPSSYYRYKVDSYPQENGSFNYTASTTSWTNIPLVNTTFLRLLNYSDANDTAEIDILLNVPLDEPAGNKNSTLTFTGWYVRVDI